MLIRSLTAILVICVICADEAYCDKYKAQITEKILSLQTEAEEHGAILYDAVDSNDAGKVLSYLRKSRISPEDLDFLFKGRKYREGRNKDDYSVYLVFDRQMDVTIESEFIKQEGESYYFRIYFLPGEADKWKLPLTEEQEKKWMYSYATTVLVHDNKGWFMPEIFDRMRMIKR